MQITQTLIRILFLHLSASWSLTMSHLIKLGLFICLFFGVHSLSMAEEEFLVDQADSLDFEEFHKISDEKKNGPSLKQRIEAAITGEKLPASTSPQQNNANYPAQNNQNVGYPAAPVGNTLIASGTLTDNANQTINNLYRTMNQHCSNGWIKHREWTQKDVTQGTFILQFEYSCK